MGLIGAEEVERDGKIQFGIETLGYLGEIPRYFKDFRENCGHRDICETMLKHYLSTQLHPTTFTKYI